MKFLYALYDDYFVYWRPYCGKVFEVFVNHISIGLSDKPVLFAQETIDKARAK